MTPAPLTVLLLAGPAARAACNVPEKPDVIVTEISLARGAMASLDAEGFDVSVERARAALPCLSGTLMPAVAADYHGLMALVAFAEGRNEAAERSLAAAVAANPDYAFSAALAPVGGPLDQLLDQARARPLSESVPMPPYDGILYVDGTPAFGRPSGRPFILQLVRSDGAVAGTYYLRPEDPLPAWALPESLVQRLVPSRRPEVSVPLATAAAGTAVLAAGLYVLGAAWNAEYRDESTPYDRLDRLQAGTNAALAGSIALTGATVALGALAVVEW